ncbi:MULTISPECIES: o-succinylbenzoate synthase [Pasteurellaceae]|uniref:o-succinylbenzoate synthase n=1 Tax=Pasteurella atlantica TaxID=2827233 RepID=A0AAW8CGJ1_9PAST|nr:o-succinylbenzoate synthase [Pasteurella atlantica]MBR0573171.1 o-succinylbenzoate synthase [Pasteurella atlantica]MDP8039213.1 o-succinylbenzoate synthase [Pasteurella atlantica]MDP8041188.1 o-succinylbenzoate synthase [Pasteurella atlantica]MDP8043325.1 o-succinylbenzoate synthase [Pasteurella atlantica]MDP8045411.1 o-succinylbenzoate synthase [Pasteurella atlantica]
MQFKLYRYYLPITTELILRGQTLNIRQGLIVQLTKKGKVGIGEIAPLPSFSVETLPQAEKQVREVLKRLHYNQNLQLEKCFPSVSFGLSCAFAELNNELSTEKIKTQTAPLFKGNKTEFITQLAQMETKIAKVKIAIQPPEQEAEAINQLLAEIPNLTLRLDANRKWDWLQAVTFGKKFAKCHRSRLEFIEEPCQTATLSQQFAEKFQLPIAWDETSREPDFFVKKQPNVTAIIIKPTLTGSLEKCKKLIEQTHQQGLQAVISSSIESSLGLSQLAHFSSQYTPNSIAGLDTLNLMQQQLVRSFGSSILPLVDLNSEFVEELVIAI